MEIEYRGAVLRRLAEELDIAPEKWDRDVIRSYRKKVNLIYGAKDEQDLYAMNGVGIQQLGGDRDGQYSMPLNDRLQLILAFRTDGDRTAVLLEISDYH